MLCIITLITAASLGLLNYITEPLIQGNEREARAAAMSMVLGDIENPVFSDEIETGNFTGVTSYFNVHNESGEGLGFVIYVENMGDQGPMTVSIGMDMEGVVLGVRLISHEETPGLGANAAKPTFLSQFAGKSGTFNVVKTRRVHTNDIVAVTAATNTSRAVTEAVNEAGRFFRDNLRR